jgi:FKBP12-rapamycin complex-associated protein
MPNSIAAAGLNQYAAPRPFQANDTLSRLLEDLCRPGAWERVCKEGERQLAEYVDAELRDLAPDAFSKFMTEVYVRIANLIKR